MGWTSNKQTGWLLRVMVMGLLLWLGWAGGTPVAAAEYRVTTSAGEIGYFCDDGAEDLRDGTYTIGTAAELAIFAGIINQTGSPTAVDFVADSGTVAAAVEVTDLTSNGRLTADIELNKEINGNPATNWEHWSDAELPSGLVQWTPIGLNYEYCYAGTFDGAGYIVRGIYINQPDLNYQGLFGNANGLAIITNLGVSESYISGEQYVGGVVGYLYGTISNCFNGGTVTGDSRVGGVAGRANTLIKCYNSGAVSGERYVGGVTGMGINLSNCYNSGGVSGTVSVASVGGVAGKGDYLSNCYNTGDVSGVDDYVGALTGSVTNISNCYYRTGSAAAGVMFSADVAGKSEAKSADAFASGEVAWRLQQGQPDPAVPVWGQQLGDGGELLPLLKTTAPVYQLTLLKGDDSLYNQSYRNAVTTILPDIEGITWKDAGGTAYPTITGADDFTLYPWLIAEPTPVPTATAVYGTKLVTITAKGNYQGTVTRTFTITATGGGGGYTPPGMSGITVTPRVISFDPSGQITVDISGLPPEAKVFYSLDGITYSTTPPGITRAGEYPLYLRITCYGYQDFNTQTLVRVGKQSPPKVSELELPLPPKLGKYTILLGQPLPADRGQTQYQVGLIEDPEALLDGPPTIDADGAMTCNFRRPLQAAADATSPSTDEGLVTAARTATIMVLVTMENYEDTTLTVVVSEAEPLGLRYQTHIQDYGWEPDWVTDGGLSGTAGQSKRLEALKVELTGDLPEGASIETAVHVQNLGDLGPFAMGSAAGTSGKSLRLENITLTLQNLTGYSLRYNVHVQNQGWLRDEADPSSWFTSGEEAGTSGKSLRLEGIRLKLVKDE